MKRSKNKIDKIDQFLPFIAGVLVLAIIFAGYRAYNEPLQSSADTPPYSVEPDVWNFTAVYFAVRAIDIKYQDSGANLHKESLRDHHYVPPLIVDRMLKELGELRNRMGGKILSEENNTIFYFMRAREEMLLSEKYFDMGLEYGKSGVFNNNLNCEDRDSIEKATAIFNLSAQNGWGAMRDLDYTLKFVPAQTLIGVNERRPLFYSNIFIDMSYLVNKNVEALSIFCDGSKVKKNLAVRKKGNENTLIVTFNSTGTINATAV